MIAELQTKSLLIYLTIDTLSVDYILKTPWMWLVKR